MAGAKRLAQLAKKWQRMEALGRKRLTVTTKEDEGCCTSVPAKGKCVVYTADGRRFEVPLVYLSTAVFGELLRMSQEEFGFASDGKITLPCDAAVLEYVMSLLRRNASAEVESALLSSMLQPCHYVDYMQLVEAESTRTRNRTMAATKRLAQLAKKWQRMEALGRKRLTVTTNEDEGCCTSTVPAKGHCVVYTTDGRRFEVPLVYLSTTVFSELLRMSQEEFGFASDGKITLPCNAAVLEYVMSLLRRNASAEVENALLSSMLQSCHYVDCAMSNVGASQQICCL
uniref:Uncharacterized protein n=1 Tax=Avena sativa TaxID=4498 RepID=A0ACD5XYJ6_AVESA